MASAPGTTDEGARGSSWANERAPDEACYKGLAGTMTVVVPIPKSEKEVSAEWITAALGSATSSPVSSVAVRRIGEGAGVTSLVLRLELSYDGAEAGPASLILKFPGTSLSGRPKQASEAVRVLRA